jgi:uncharacterized membrane protein (UPF0136 family)
MTAQSLITAVTIGLVLGVTGRLVLRRARGLPMWLPLCAGVGAALLASVMARLAHHDGPVPAGTELAVQVLFAVAGVAVVAMTADRPPRTHWQRRGNR